MESKNPKKASSPKPKPHKLRKRYVVDSDKKTKGKRKVFHYYDNPKEPILAGGVIFVSKEKKDNYIFLQIQYDNDKCCINHKLSDFGGKTDMEDHSIADTITRELNEETNFQFYIKNTKTSKRRINTDNKDEIAEANKYVKKCILDNLITTIYVPKSKYVIFLCNIPEEWKGKRYHFGEYEETDRIKRKATWVSVNEFFDKYFEEKLIHPRLWNGDLLKLLKKYIKPKYGFSE